MRKPVLYVMSGGGARGIECHTGILMALETKGILPDKYRGTSAGAIVSMFYASGYSANGIFRIIKENPFDTLVKRNWGWFWWANLYGTLYDRTALNELIRKKVGKREYNSVQVTVTRKDTQNTEYMYGSAETAIASSSIPVVFKPHQLGSHLYVDGGVKDNIPTPPARLREMYEHIYIMICNDDNNIERHYASHLGRGLKWLDSTMSREYSQVVHDWSGYDNVTIIKPSPFESSLLNWSENFKLVTHAYEETLKLL